MENERGLCPCGEGTSSVNYLPMYKSPAAWSWLAYIAGPELYASSAFIRFVTYLRYVPLVPLLRSKRASGCRLA